MYYGKVKNLQHLIDCTVYNFDPHHDVGVSKIFSLDHVEVEEAAAEINRSLDNRTSASVSQVTKISVFATSIGLSYNVCLVSSHEYNYIHPYTMSAAYTSFLNIFHQQL